MQSSTFDRFEHIYVVHLLGEDLRRQHIEAEFARLNIGNFEFYPACRADSFECLEIQLSDAVHKYPGCFRCGKEYCGCPNNVLIRPQIANWQSFLGAFQNSIDRQFEFCLMCEDDVKFVEYAEEVIEKLLLDPRVTGSKKSDSPLLIRMGYPGFHPAIHRYDGNATYTREQRMSNSCFAFNRAFAQHVLDNFTAINHTSDVFFHRQVIDDRVMDLTMEPPPCFDLSQARQVASSIHPKQVDADDRRRDKTHVKRLTPYVAIHNSPNKQLEDSLSLSLFQQISLVRPKLLDAAEISGSNREYYAIGNVSQNILSEQAKIWGIGTSSVPSMDSKLHCLSDHQIFASAGNNTKANLEQNEILTSDSFTACGNPACLTELLFPRKKQLQHSLGVFVYGLNDTEKAANWTRPDLARICLEGWRFDCFESFIDTIISCQKIATNSAAVLAIAHSYMIPAAAVQLTDTGSNNCCNDELEEYLESMSLTPRVHNFEQIDSLSQDATNSLHWTFPEQAKLAQVQEELLKFCPFNVHAFSRQELKTYHKNKLTQNKKRQLQPLAL